MFNEYKGFNPYSIQGIVHRRQGQIQVAAGRDVSILTQYKALFIGRTSIRIRQVGNKFQSLLNTRHCSSEIHRWRTSLKISFQSLLNTRHCSSENSKGERKWNYQSFNPYSIQGIVHQKLITISNLEKKKSFNPYSIQGIVHQKTLRLGKRK